MLLRKRRFESAWSPREDRHLLLSYRDTPNSLLAERFGRTQEAIRVRAKRIGATKEHEQPWTEEEKHFVMTAKLSLSEKARILGRTRSSVSTKRFFLRRAES